MVYQTDAAGTMLTRELEQKLPNVLKKKYPRLWAAEGEYIPSVGDLDEAVDLITQDVLTEVGEANVLSPAAEDIPLVDVNLTLNEYKALQFVAGVKFNIQEVKKAQKVGRDIVSLRMNALELAMRQAIHRFVIAGSKKHGITGFFNSPDVTPVSSSYDASTATAQDSIDFVVDNMTRVETDTNLTEGIAVLMVPPRLRALWEKQLVPNTSTTVISHLLEKFGPSNGGTLRRIVKVNECAAAYLEDPKNAIKSSGDNDDRCIFLPVDPMAVERHFFATKYLPIQGPNKFSYEQYAYCGSSEPIIQLPGAMLYVDIPKVD